MTQQTRHHGQGNASHDRVAGEGMPEVVETYIRDVCGSPDLSPERKFRRSVGRRVSGGREDVRSDAGLPRKDSLGLGAEKNRSGTGL